MDQVFSRYYRENHWGNPESRSGKGSSLAGSQYVREILPTWFRDYGIRRLLDAPCGDFHWMRHLVSELDEYVGADIVADLVRDVSERFGGPGVRFIQADLTRDPLPQMDAALCRDFLGHLPLALGLAALANLRRSGATYLISHSDPGENRDVPVGGFVWINLCAPPFDFPEPLAEAAEPHNGGKNVRRIGLWRFSDLPV